jgi:hypothetical protein
MLANVYVCDVAVCHLNLTKKLQWRIYAVVGSCLSTLFETRCSKIFREPCYEKDGAYDMYKCSPGKACSIKIRD